MRGGAFFNGKEGRDDFRKTAPEGGYIPNPYGRDLGLGYRVRTLPQGTGGAIYNTSPHNTSDTPQK